MHIHKITILALSLSLGVSACQTAPQKTDTPNPAAANAAASSNLSSCGGDKYANLVGKPLPPVRELDIANDSRYYGRDEFTVTDNPKRLNFVLSTEYAHQALGNPNATVVRVFCG